ncbi:MAG: HAMP domain-containing histidine kinase [Acidobacteria bacterium]|nr:HAMP domain-containing histidine kinase [Acidobacteriota bacterium]
MTAGANTPQPLREILHEIRTPLAALAAMSSNVEDSARETYLSVLEHLSGILHRGLAGHAPAAGDTEDRVDLADAVGDAVRLVRAASRDDAFRVQASGDLGVRGDRVLLTQIMVNLLANALRHSPAGQAVEVRAYRTGGSVTVEVEDRGEGVPDELKERVFDTGASFGNHNGDGIGLALSRRLAEQMHGTLRLLDAPGAVFSLILPAA